MGLSFKTVTINCAFSIVLEGIPKDVCKKISESINISITGIWGREKPSINLYSARHQFAANLKASDIEDGLVTYLMGQLFDDTKHRHYASEKKGEIRPAPYNVLEIQSFVQKEINEKVRLKESMGVELQD